VLVFEFSAAVGTRGGQRMQSAFKSGASFQESLQEVS